MCASPATTDTPAPGAPLSIHGRNLGRPPPANDGSVALNAGERDSRKSDNRAQVRLHPAEAAMARAAAAGDERAREYLAQLEDRHRAARRLSSALLAVRDMPSDHRTITDAWSEEQLLAEAAREVIAAEESGDAGRIARADEALTIILRAELVCCDERHGYAGSRTTAGRQMSHTRTRYRVDGRELAVECGREVTADWSLSPPSIGARIAACSVAWGVGVDAAGSGFAAPFGCGAALCPRCAHGRGGARVRAYLPVVAALVDAGYQVVHVTATQRADLGGRQPVILTDRERPTYHRAMELAGIREARRRGRAVPGRALGVELGTLADAWATVTNGDKRSRAWWRSTVAGGITGTEWTGRRPLAGSYIPRWHAHRHALLVLRRGVDVDAWREAWIGEWCRRADAEPGGQRVIPVDGHERGIVGSLVETLKYPFKVAEVTTAQACEIVSAAAGLHLHQLTGAWHASSRVGAAARAGDWSQLAPDDAELAEALAAGYARRDLAAHRSILLYREPGPGERAPRRTRIESDDPWGDAPATHLAPVTVRWMRDQIARGRTVEELRSYSPADRSWTAPISWCLPAVLEQLEHYAPADPDAAAMT